ncbi:hypothetical protein [Streptomyces sp. NPDC060035]|uniref:hypothetical protein n=1 Tax=Streptomyces sp. NPDC060035 TaxID=3347044 RepID=UPI0036B95653
MGEMAKVSVSIVHDEIGRIVAVARPSKDVKAVVSVGEGQSVFETEVEEGSIPELASGNHRVDVANNSVVAY